MQVADVFSRDTGVWRVLETMTTLIVLNVLVVLTSLPVITLGVSLSAAYAVHSDTSEDFVSATRGYFRALLAHRRQATAVFWSGLAMVFALVGVAYVIPVPFLRYVPLVLAAIVLLVVQAYLPLLPVADAGWRRNVLTGLHVALRQTWRPVLALSAWAVAAVVPVYAPGLFFAWLFLGIGVPLLVSSRLMTGAYRSLSLLPDEEDDHAGAGSADRRS
jgi:hypothetical protein